MVKFIEAPTKEFLAYIPTKLLYGTGSLKKLHEQPMPGKKAMICITPEPFYRDLGYLDELENELKLAGVEYIYFDKVRPNPLSTTVNEGGKFVRDNNVDMLISFGGGSSHDCAKAISVSATNEGDIWDYLTRGTGKGKPITNKPLPLIAVTTTSGTGSETDQFAVLNNPFSKEKIGLNSPDYPLFPVICVVDPALTESIPPNATAMQGFDAWTHCAECYICEPTNWLSDIYAIAGVEHSALFLSRAVKDGSDMIAREHLAIAAHLGGRVISIAACTGMHALEQAMSAYFEALPHGIGLAMLAHAYFEKTISKHAADDRIIKMAQVMGMPNANKVEDFITVLDKLLSDIGLDDLKMSDYEITKSDLAKFVENARTTMDGDLKCDLVPFTDKELLEILEQSYK